MHKEFKRSIHGSLKLLKPVLSTWQELMSPDFWDYANDAPWWYNERALLSLFAGAVWKCKGKIGGGDVLKLFKKTLSLNGSSPSFTIEKQNECS